MIAKMTSQKKKEGKIQGYSEWTIYSLILSKKLLRMDFFVPRSLFIGLLIGLLEDSDRFLLFRILSLLLGVNPALRTFLVVIDLRFFF